MDLFEIGESIRKARKAQKMTLEQLAEASGVSRVTLSKIETGSAYDVKFSTMMRTMNALDLILKVTNYNGGMPVYEDLIEQEEEDEAPGLG